MKAPLAWLRDYVDLPSNTDAIVQKLAQLGFPVDAIEEPPPLSGVVVGQITKIEKHPNADRLQVCTIDIAGPRPLIIATAATNVAQGQTIPVATIGATLAGGLTIAPRKMRGLDSEGMLCSAEELGFEGDWFEDGIMQLDPGTPLGTDVIARFGLDLPVLDVDITPNRVDAMCMLGLARELAAGFGTTVREPETSVSYGNVGIDEKGGVIDDAFDSHDITVKLESPDCRRFVVQRVSNVRVRPAKAWMRLRLALAGQRPISNIVDISNFVMLEVGQPLHFYDFDKLAGRSLTVRDARAKEHIRTLDAVDRELTPAILVIADSEQAQCLAGLKGAAASEVTQATHEIAIEAANFSGPRIRRGGIALGLRSDASARHEKALPIALADLGAARAARLLEQEGAVIHQPRGIGRPVPEAPSIELRKSEIPRLLGFALPNDTIVRHLQSLGFQTNTMLTNALVKELDLGADDVDNVTSFEVRVPGWRSDVAIEADLVEEIARIAGYDNVKAEIPSIGEQVIASEQWLLQGRVARAMALLGYREVMTLALQPGSIGTRWRDAGIEFHGTPVEIQNPLSEDQRFMRFSLVPGLLALEQDRIFEIGNVFGEAGEVVERTHLTFLRRTRAVQAQPWADDAFVALKSDALAFVRSVTGRLPSVRAAAHAGWHPGVCAELVLDDQPVALVGALDPRLGAAFGAHDRVHVTQIDLAALPAYDMPIYLPPSQYPSLSRDIALVLDTNVAARDVERVIATSVDGLGRSVRAFDEYRGPQVGEGKKSIAVRIVLQRSDATMTDTEADTAIEKTLQALGKEFGATIRR